MKYGRLQDFEEEKLRARGEKVLAQYYELKKKEIASGLQVEINFAKQSVNVDGALLNGKIDKVIENPGKTWIVVDLKTGKGFSEWDEKGQSVYDEIKLHHYKNQLMMYKILVENSRDYAKYSVEKGVLEFVEEVAEGRGTNAEQTRKDAEEIQELVLSFDSKDLQFDLERFKKLIVAVYTKITTLDTSNVLEHH